MLGGDYRSAGHVQPVCLRGCCGRRAIAGLSSSSILWCVPELCLARVAGSSSREGTNSVESPEHSPCICCTPWLGRELTTASVVERRMHTPGAQDSQVSLWA